MNENLMIVIKKNAKKTEYFKNKMPNLAKNKKD